MGSAKKLQKLVAIGYRHDGGRRGERLKDMELRGGTKNDLTNPVIGYFAGPGTTGGVHKILLDRQVTVTFLSFQIKSQGTLQINGIKLGYNNGESEKHSY